MSEGSQLICDDTWPGDRDLQLPRCLLKKTDIESLSVSIPSEVEKRMEHVSQIGLKNQYLGKPPGKHNRWNHARGVYTIGLIWLHSLYNSDAVPLHLKTRPYPDYATARTLLGYCLLLHDYGHLPFSHLLEEAIHSINWVPLESGQSSLEYTVLRDRLTADDSISTDLQQMIRGTLPASAPAPLRDDPIRGLIQLTHGWSGLPWLQAIVNGPVDADKIDYLRRDQQFLQKCGFPVQTRLALYSGNTGDNLPWLTEFLWDQFVNHLGLLCLPGRSAVAAIDLWRERLVLYERFYLSPVIRAADRIALEVVQQFLIRAVMSESFGRQIMSHPDIATAVADGRLDVRDLGWLVQGAAGSADSGVELIAVKYRAVTALLNRLSIVYGKTSERDWECFSFMWELVKQVQSTDQRYREMLENSVAALQTLKDGDVKALNAFAHSFIIGDPIQFHREQRDTVREIARSFQQQYFSDVLIDVHSMPRVLSIPPNPRPTPMGRSPRLAHLLVPKGPAEKWSSGSRELEPLTSEKVRSLERPFGRILLLSPPNSNKAKARYVYDRLLAELRQKQILYEEVKDR